MEFETSGCVGFSLHSFFKVKGTLEWYLPLSQLSDSRYLWHMSQAVPQEAISRKGSLISHPEYQFLCPPSQSSEQTMVNKQHLAQRTGNTKTKNHQIPKENQYYERLTPINKRTNTQANSYQRKQRRILEIIIYCIRCGIRHCSNKHLTCTSKFYSFCKISPEEYERL